MNNSAKMIFLASSLLLMIGVVMIYSSSAVYADSSVGDSLYFVKRHLAYLFMGLLAAVWCMSLPPELVRDKARALMIISLILLFAVLVPGIGTKVGGARRWIRLFSFGFQPSELAKLALIIYLADFTSKKRYVMQDLRQGFIPAFLVICMTGGLVLVEPDLGTSVVIGVIGVALLFVSGARMKYLLTLVLSALPFLAAVILAAPYRIKRITAFLSPWSDPRGSGFQLIQSFIALGSGGFAGVGLGASKQKLFYLPQSHTDFIYSIIGEELGFIGTTFVLLLFAVLILYSLRIALKNNELFTSRVILGICVMIAFETIVNIGVSTGILPTKGLPLPFISYGGSSLVMHMAAVGLLLNMSRSMEE